MSVRDWPRPLLTGLVVSAATGAAQLGVAYGFAILVWTKDFSDPVSAAWAANLTWVCWLAATSVVAGAVAGGWEAWQRGLPRSVLTRIALALTAAVGALSTVPLVAIPARYAELPGGESGPATAARLAVIGVLCGAVVGFGVLLGRPMAWNVVATSAWLWLLAVGTVLVALTTGAQPDATRLALWGTSEPRGWFLVVVPMLLVSAVIGAGIALVAKREGRHKVSVAVCGAPGPILVAVAYLAAGPGTRPDTGEQFLPYLAAPYAVLTGLLGSLLVAAIERPEPDARAAASPAGQSALDRGNDSTVEAMVTETVPGGTVPASTVPASTVPASTVPASTVPASSVPASTRAGSPVSGGTVLGGTEPGSASAELPPAAPDQLAAAVSGERTLEALGESAAATPGERAPAIAGSSSAAQPTAALPAIEASAAEPASSASPHDDERPLTDSHTERSWQTESHTPEPWEAEPWETEAGGASRGASQGASRGAQSWQPELDPVAESWQRPSPSVAERPPTEELESSSPAQGSQAATESGTPAPELPLWHEPPREPLWGARPRLSLRPRPHSDSGQPETSSEPDALLPGGGVTSSSTAVAPAGSDVASSRSDVMSSRSATTPLRSRVTPSDDATPASDDATPPSDDAPSRGESEKRGSFLTQRLPFVSRSKPKPKSEPSDDAEPDRGRTDADEPTPEEWEEAERWLRQIKGEDEPPRTFRPAPVPGLERPHNRKWTLFANHEEELSDGGTASSDPSGTDS